MVKAPCSEPSALAAITTISTMTATTTMRLQDALVGDERQLEAHSAANVVKQEPEFVADDGGDCAARDVINHAQDPQAAQVRLVRVEVPSAPVVPPSRLHTPRCASGEFRVDKSRAVYPGLHLGATFDNYNELTDLVNKFQLAKGVHLYIRSSRKLYPALNQMREVVRAYNHDLMFAEIYYACTKGGRRFVRHQQNDDQRNCPFNIKLRLTKDGKQLYIRDIYPAHNHVLDRTLTPRPIVAAGCITNDEPSRLRVKYVRPPAILARPSIAQTVACAEPMQLNATSKPHMLASDKGLFIVPATRTPNLLGVHAKTKPQQSTAPLSMRSLEVTTGSNQVQTNASQLVKTFSVSPKGTVLVSSSVAGLGSLHSSCFVSYGKAELETQSMPFTNGTNMANQSFGVGSIKSEPDVASSTESNVLSNAACSAVNERFAQRAPAVCLNGGNFITSTVCDERLLDSKGDEKLFLTSADTMIKYELSDTDSASNEIALLPHTRPVDPESTDIELSEATEEHDEIYNTAEKIVPDVERDHSSDDDHHPYIKACSDETSQSPDGNASQLHSQNSTPESDALLVSRLDNVSSDICDSGTVVQSNVSFIGNGNRRPDQAPKADVTLSGGSEAADTFAAGKVNDPFSKCFTVQRASTKRPRYQEIEVPVNLPCVDERFVISRQHVLNMVRFCSTCGSQIVERYYVDKPDQLKVSLVCEKSHTVDWTLNKIVRKCHLETQPLSQLEPIQATSRVAGAKHTTALTSQLSAAITSEMDDITTKREATLSSRQESIDL